MEQEPTTKEMLKWLIDNFSEDFKLMLLSDYKPSGLEERIKMLYYSKKAEKGIKEEKISNRPYPYNKDFSSTADY